MDREAGTLHEPAGSDAPAQRSSSSVTVGDEERTILTDAIVAALRLVFDPEIPVNVYDLGLIYRIEPLGQGLIEIDMTLTAPGCPVAGEMLNQVRTAASGVEGVANVKVNLVFDPPWDRSKMSEEAKLELGLI